MAVQRVDQLRDKSIVEQREILQPQHRLNLFTTNNFERVRSLRFPDGSRVDVPAMSEQDRQNAALFFDSVPIERRESLQASTEALTKAIYDESQNNGAGIETASFSSRLVSQLGETFEDYMLTTGADKADQAVQSVMFGAMVGIEQELGDFAKSFQEKIDLAGEVRTDITELRDEIADPTWDDGSTRSFSWTEVTVDENGNMRVTQNEGELTKEEAELLLKKLEDQLATLSEMNDVARFDLQRMTQDYQQALSTLSNLLKSQHDSLMAIIRNTKAS